MAKQKIIIFLLLLGVQLNAQQKQSLWDGNMPNSNGMTITDSVDNGRMRRVGTPHFYVFTPSADDNKGVGVIICPPGGYAHLTYDIAGFQLAKWFNTMGITAFVLIHRLPTSPDIIEREKAPLMDVSRMIDIVRSRASEWRLDTSRIGVMGCSAGGHLAAMLPTANFRILVSPVITMGENSHAGSRKNLLGDSPSADKINLYSAEKNVTETSPPAIIFHAADDKTVPVENSILYFRALHQKGVKASLHIFPYGGHNIALRNNHGSTQSWTTICEMWLREMNILE